MIRLLTFLFAVLIVFGGCTAREEAPKPEAEREHEMVEKVIDPVCGMEIEKDAAIVVEHDGATYYLCSNECKEDFMKDPDKFAKAEKQVDPVCGMEVLPSSEHMHKHHDETYYFCSTGCKDQFKKEPEKFLKTK